MNLKPEPPCRLPCLKLGMTCAGTSNEKATLTLKRLGEAVKVWLKMLAPFAPFICEELWSQTGEEGFISVATWPVFDESKVDVPRKSRRTWLLTLLSDTSNILKSHEDHA